MADQKEKMYNLVFLTVSLFALAFALTNQMDAHREDYSRMLASNPAKPSAVKKSISHLPVTAMNSVDFTK